ncbi:MAG: hypothetical protein FJW86_08690 [Actinobacteria bacterium]|nr:hypothetical protein [Actinomycetota bacterium]
MSATSDLITIRRPTAVPPPANQAPAFTLDASLAGKTIGLRTDMAWRSWQLIAEEWARFLERDGATTLPVETMSQVGKGGHEDRTRIDTWSEKVDGGFVGLGTCGSCTSFTIHDSVTLEQHEKPAVAVVCSEFESHARNMARFLGHGDLKVLVMPYPLEARPDDELRQIALEYYPQALALLGVQS